jgi:hypothetical protein
MALSLKLKSSLGVLEYWSSGVFEKAKTQN